MHNLSSRVYHAAKAAFCAALVAACNSSSPLDVDSVTGLAGKGGGGATQGALEISPVQVDFGSTGTSKTLTLSNSSNRAISWTATENVGWLSLGSTSGSISRWSNKTVGLTAQRNNLAPGTHTTNLTFVSGGVTDVVPVSITVPSAPSQLTVTPTQVDFGTTATSATITLKNNGTTSLAWTATETMGWLSLTLLAGTIAAGSTKAITLTASRSGKSPGTYTGTVAVTAGTAGSVNVPVLMTVPSTSSSVLLAGQLINQFDGHAMTGLTVQFAGKSATTDGSGRFTIPGTPTSSLNTLTVTGGGIHKRITYAKTGDTIWRVVPASFSMSAFNDVARDEFGPSTVRWVARPTVYIDTRPEGFSSSELSTWINEVKAQVPGFISKWTGGTITPASVIVTSNPPSDFSSGTIVIHFSDNSSDYGGSSTTIGYARLFYTSSGAVSGSAIWLRYPRYPGTGGASKRKGILGHELGHGIGLGHMEGSTPSLMAASIGSKTDLLDFDLKSASFHYGRSPHNGSPDTDDQSSFLGMLVPSAAPVDREWLCEGGEE